MQSGAKRDEAALETERQWPTELMTALSALGWFHVGTRTTANGLVLHTLGRGMLTGLGGALHTWEEKEERSVGGWEYWLANE